ncbi:cell surface protein SprA [bacterium]|nr:cell surface protein SprA [bacterium]
MRKISGQEFILLIGLLTSTLLMLHVGQADGSIRFSRSYATERMIDPTRFAPKYGMSSVLWDSSQADTTMPEGLDTLAVPQDSTLIGEISPPDSGIQPADSSLPAVKEIPLVGVEDLQPLQIGEEGKTPETGSADIPVDESTDQSTADGFPGDELEPFEREESKDEEDLPYHPTLIYLIDIPLEVEAELDTTTDYVILSKRLNGVEMPTTGALSKDVYLERSLRMADHESWRQSVLRKLPSKTESKGGGLVIELPIIRSERAQRIFGGQNIGLSVSGHIEVSGDLGVVQTEELQQDNPNPTNYQFNVNQTQSFVIKGKVGEKVDVDISQDSERMFDFENNLSIRYTGDEDEILKSLEAGNISLSLGGASLVSSSSKHKGLFGFKTESQFGALRLTTVASLEKGKKNQLTKEGGAQSSGRKTIPPYDYIQNRYFFLPGSAVIDTLIAENDTTIYHWRDYYRNHYKERDNYLNPFAVPLDSQIVKIEVYRSPPLTKDVASFYGWALYDLRDSTIVSDPDSIRPQEHQDGTFEPLRQGSDYEYNSLTGYIRLNTTVDNAILAVAYSIQALNSDSIPCTFGQLEPSNRDTNYFKLLKPKSPQPTDSTWNLMWRNVYSLKGTNLSREGFEGRITYQSDEDEQRQDTGPYKGEVKTFIEIFGLDHFGAQAGQNSPDGNIDEAFINWERGELTFPDLKPFAPEGWSKGGQPQKTELDSTQLIKHADMYTKTGRERSRTVSDYQIEVEFTSISTTTSLGIGVLEGSVEVYLNGQQLAEGIDFTVDYISGELTILRSAAFTENADIEIKYETAQLFQLDTKTLLGLRAEYELWDGSSIGATMLHLNQKTLDRRVRVGGEPIRNSIWGLDANMNFKPFFLTSAMDWLPLIETDEPSTFSIKAEVAQVFPDPNNLNSPSTGDYNGVAYIDDFESIKRITPLGINRKQWSAASFPEYDGRGDALWKKRRGRMIWFNPWQQIDITEIWPDKEVQAQASKIPVMEIQFKPWWNDWDLDNQLAAAAADSADAEEPEQYWGGVIRYLGSGYADQTEAKFLEIWLNLKSNVGNENVMYIDLGRISEDAIPNNLLNTEDRPQPGRTVGNGILTRDEDTGIDLIDADDPADMIDVNGDGRNPPQLLPSYDEWQYDASRSKRSDYSHINGTEGNIEDEGGRYPDTEDLNNDTNIDRANDFYRYKIDLSEGNGNRYIVMDNPNGWRLYRIPLKDMLEVGSPSMASLEYARIWLTGFERPVRLQIAQIDIVGNEWREVEVSDDRGGMMDPVSVSVVNTDDNPEYSPPPGVSGELDPITNLRSREQSLMLKINRLRGSETCEVIKQLSHHQKMDLSEYRRMKMFVYLDDQGRDCDLEMSLRFGYDSDKRYYEYSRRLNPGWEGNEVIIDFDRLTSLNFLRQQDSLRNYDILPDGAIIRVVGNPSLRDIRFFSLGIKNHGHDIYEQDEVGVWFDELRLSDIHDDPGWAAKGSVDLKVARDLMTFHADLSQTQADFRGVDMRVGKNKDYLTGRVSASFKLDALFNPQWNLNLPLTMNFSQGIDVPKYQTDSDVLLSAMTDERIDIWSIFMDNLKSNDRYSYNPKYQKPIDAQINTEKKYSYGFSASKRKFSDNPWTKYTVERIRLSRLSLNKRYVTSSSYMYSKDRDLKGDLSYDLSFEKPLELNWLAWTENLPLLGRVSESTFKPLPTSFGTSVGATESMERYVKWNKPDTEEENYGLATDRSFNISFKPIAILSIDFDQTVRADRVRLQAQRDTIALEIARFEVDRTPYWDGGILVDTTGWEEALEAEKRGVQDKMFWKLFGTHFIDHSFNQNFSFNLTPSFVSWLSTSASYTPRYNWSWSRNYDPGGRRVEVGSGFGTNVILKLPQIVRLWVDKKSGKPGDASGGDMTPWEDEFPGLEELDKDKSDIGGKFPPGSNKKPPPWIDEFDYKGRADIPVGDDASGESKDKFPEGEDIPARQEETSDEEESKTDFAETAEPDSLEMEEEKPSRKQDPLLLLRGLLTRLSDISWRYDQNNRYLNPAIELGQANWKYRLGLTRDPGLKNVEGFAYTNNFSRNDQHTFSTRLDFSKNITINQLRYEYGWIHSINESAGLLSESGSYSRTVWQYFDSDGRSIKTFPALNWSVRWSGWETLPLLEKITTSVSLDNSFSGSARESWNKTANDAERVTQSIEYEKSFQPLIGVNFIWLWNVNTDVNYNLNQSVSDQTLGNRKTRSLTKEFRLSARYNSRKGFRIPIPVWPFKNRRFKNNTTFSVVYNNRTSKSESSVDNSKFDLDREDSSWSFRPSIDYQFSNTVSGSFFYEYAVQRSVLTGKTFSQDFGFRVNISIRG